MSAEHKDNQVPSESKASSSGAYLVAAGIFLSRIAGLVRERVFANYFGNSDSGDAFKAALKIPNFLQNLFGEGVLSASFIPVYAKLRAKGEFYESAKVANAVVALLALITSTLTLLGIVFTPSLINIIAPGFQEGKRLLTIKLVQIFFPGTALLVMSAWCLGILNSHRKFFLSYAAPVIWNVAQIAALIFFGGRTDTNDLAIKVAWALVIGSGLQFGIQLPVVLSLLNHFRPNLAIKSAAVKEVITNFFPIVIARGVVQVSAYIDNLLASLLPTGAVSSLAYAQIIYLLPVSLFGMSVSAAELPAMSSVMGSATEIAAGLQKKLNNGLQQIAFFIIPSVVAFLALGDIVVGVLYQTGKFTYKDTVYVWTVLGGYALGLLATTLGRLYSSTFYALQDTKTPLRCAIIRISFSIILGYTFSIYVPRWLNIDRSWGTIGLTVAASLSSWLEFTLLRHYLNKRIGNTGLVLTYTIKLWGAALLGATIGWLIKLAIGLHHPVIMAGTILLPFGVVYLSICWLLGVPQVSSVVRRVARFLPK